MDGSKALGVIVIGVTAGIVFLVVTFTRGCKYAVDHADVKHNAGFVPTIEINPNKQPSQPEPAKPLSTADIYVQTLFTKSLTNAAGETVESVPIRVQNRGSHDVSEITLKLVFYGKAGQELERGGEFVFPLKKKLGKYDQAESSFEYILAPGDPPTASVIARVIGVK